MGINKESTGFTFLFAIVMVVVVGAILAIAAMGLKPFQDENIRQEKMKNILMAIKVMDMSSDMAAAPDLFEQHVKERILLDVKGEVVSTKSGSIDRTDMLDAFNTPIKKEYKTDVKPVLSKYKKDPEKCWDELCKLSEVHYPLFKCEKEGRTYYVIPMTGTGLWGPIWGFMGIEDDMETVYAAVFDHKTETPGLGAEINQKAFQKGFEGEKIFDEAGNYAPIAVVKGGADPADLHGVDAITGGTLTSNGVGEMLARTIRFYVPYLKNNKKQ